LRGGCGAGGAESNKEIHGGKKDEKEGYKVWKLSRECILRNGGRREIGD